MVLNSSAIGIDGCVNAISALLLEEGLFLFPGQVSDATLEKRKAILELDPDNVQAKEAYEICTKTVGRPNRKDIDDACDFVKEKRNIK